MVGTHLYLLRRSGKLLSLLCHIPNGLSDRSLLWLPPPTQASPGMSCLLFSRCASCLRKQISVFDSQPGSCSNMQWHALLVSTDSLTCIVSAHASHSILKVSYQDKCLLVLYISAMACNSSTSTLSLGHAIKVSFLHHNCCCELSVFAVTCSTSTVSQSGMLLHQHHHVVGMQ